MRIKNVRFIVAAITTFSAYAVYVSRVNLSMAIIAMVEDHHGEHKISHRQANLSQYDEPSAGLEYQVVSQSPDGNRSLPLIIDPLKPARESNASATPHKEALSTIFPLKSVKTPLISQEKFHWSQAEQGHILGAFFYGYVLFQVPGARMAESVGAKWIIMAATAGSALISLTFPLSTQLNSIYLLMVLRFVMGLCQSAFFPAAYVLFCRWLPEHERSILLPIMFIGSNVGSISTYIMSSYLISSSYGWPSVFYLSGLVCAVVSILWVIFGSNRPDDNWLITTSERQYIESNVNDQSSESNSLSNAELDQQQMQRLNGQRRQDPERLPTIRAATKIEPTKPTLEPHSPDKRAKRVSAAVEPEPSWSKFFRSVPIWTLILSMYGNEWSNVVLCFELPTYLNSALAFPIEQNGVINSFFQLTYAVASPIMSSLGAYMLDKHVCSMRKIHVRKLFQSIATFGQMICFISVPICGHNRGLIITFMFLAVLCKTCANAGDIMVAGDLSPEYAGTIFAFANSIGNTAGVLVPNFAGRIVKNQYERELWTPFWFTTAAIMGCSGLIFLIFGETRQQDFEKDSRETRKVSELSIDSERVFKLTGSAISNHNKLTTGRESLGKIHRINTALSI